MLILTTLQADIQGNVSTVGYVFGGIAVIVAVAVVYLCVRLFRARR